MDLVLYCIDEIIWKSLLLLSVALRKAMFIQYSDVESLHYEHAYFHVMS